MNTSPSSKDSEEESSMLDALLKSSGSQSGASPVSSENTKESAIESLVRASSWSNSSENNTSSSPKMPKPKKPPMKPADFLKIIGAIFVVSMIFFGSFLAYIVFNPGEAQFFRSFNIEPARIADILRTLVNAIFGVLTFFFSIVWIIFLFRAIITKWDFRKKKVTSIILAILFGIILFSNLSFWMFLVKKIGISDYANPNGGVILYDNERLLSKDLASSAELASTSELIGPITIRFDIKSNAKYIAKMIDIESFDIDFDGDGSINPDIGEISGGKDPEWVENLVFTYDKKKTYAPKGRYTGIDKITREKKTMDIEFPKIVVTGLVDIRRNEAKKTITFDATDITRFGNPKWYESTNINSLISSEKVYASKIEVNEKYLCLVLERTGQSSNVCSKVFLVFWASSDAISGRIATTRDPNDPFTYVFSLENIKIRDSAEIVSYQWTLDTGTVIGQSESITYVFNEYRKGVKVSVKLKDSAGRTSILESGDFNIARPLQLMRSVQGDSLLKVVDERGMNLILKSYDPSLLTYRISFDIPGKLIFDAEDVRVQSDSGYEIESAEWEIDGTKKIGKKIEFEFNEEKRYTVNVTYIFVSSQWAGKERVSEKIIMEWKKKDLKAVLKIDQDSNYIPATVRFDGSASVAKAGSIVKFIYDFGAGKPAIEGDAVQTYVYDNPGVYTVTLTVVKDDGTKDIMTHKIVLNDIPKQLIIRASVSSWKTWMAVDFHTDATGQIESYSWDFGDESIKSSEPNPSHIYEKAGKYPVKLDARYADGTTKTAEMTFSVED